MTSHANIPFRRLLLASLLAAHAGAHAYAGGALVPTELNGRMSTAEQTYSFSPDASGMSGSVHTGADNGGPNAWGTIHAPADPAILAKPFLLTLDAEIVLAPAVTVDVQVTESFSASGNFSIQLAGVSDNFLTGSVTGGTIRGQLGSSSGITITFDVSDLSSQILSLAGTPTTLTFEGSAWSPLALSCTDQAGGCTGGPTYLAPFALSTYPNFRAADMRLHLPGSAFAPAVPEPQTSTLLLIGLSAAAWTIRRRTAAAG